jgi:hypothetical protein
MRYNRVSESFLQMYAAAAPLSVKVKLKSVKEKLNKWTSPPKNVNLLCEQSKYHRGYRPDDHIVIRYDRSATVLDIRCHTGEAGAF